ncbi:unnamed protein product [Rhizoctonia solani]|uniref:Zn(2)-C6 fungal-type domain-containing protein n=1 Tax=Rhizoctonia solani TaxID=456999 RepID=A0A8H3DN70_9AGAM|nr:unnamed protein product [Rhizoctonia solani]
MAQRSAPGPVGTSCLTCKRRHKKCDQRRPTCTRCEQGGFECLGYGHHRSTARLVPPRPPKPRPIMPVATPEGTEPGLSLIGRPIIVNRRVYSGTDDDNTDKSSSTGDATEGTNTPGSSSQLSESSGISCALRKTPHTKDPHARTPVTGGYLSRFGSSATSSLPTLVPSLQQIFTTFFRMPSQPSNPTMAFLSGPQFQDYLLVHLDRMLDYAYFKPVRDQKARVFETLTSRLRSSWITRWVALLDVRICESLVTDTPQPQLYGHWIRDLEVAVRTTLAWDSASREAHELQGDWLEARFLSQTFNVHFVYAEFVALDYEDHNCS